MKIVKVDYDDGRKCMGCCWEHNTFYRLGESSILDKDDDPEVWGDGNCADCFMEFLIEEGYIEVISQQVPSDADLDDCIYQEEESDNCPQTRGEVRSCEECWMKGLNPKVYQI